MDVLQVWWLMLKQSEAILQLWQTLQSFPHRQVDQCSALQSHVLTRSFLRRETADPTAATKGKRWTSAGSQICQVITKLCIKHWHKHRCAHTNLACSMCCTSTHTRTHCFLFFPLQPLFWLKTVQIAYSCGLDPRGRGAAVQTLLERCEIKTCLLWQKPTTSIEAERAPVSAKPNLF